MKGRIFSFLTLTLAFLLLPKAALAYSIPGFPTCTSPQGSVIANYSDGTHGVAGGTSQAGSDTVYTVTEGNALQCLCVGDAGTQTNWWRIDELSYNDIQSLQNQGWVYVPNGADWGLSDGAYLAYNLSYSCSTNTPTPPGGGGGGNPSAPVCTDSAPSSAPTITSIVTSTNSVVLTWTAAGDPVSYYLIAYGTQPGNYTFGNPNVGNVTTYTINGLSGGQTYYFVVRGIHGCMPGPLSNEVSNKVFGGFFEGAAAGFLPGVLGVATPSAESVIDLTKSVCAQCIWLPELLGEIAVLVAWYLLAKRKNIANKKRWIVGLLIGILTYIVFLILNKGHVCPDAGIGFWRINIPCRYFWALDIVVFLLLSWLMTNKATSQKKTPKKN